MKLQPNQENNQRTVDKISSDWEQINAAGIEMTLGSGAEHWVLGSLQTGRQKRAAI